MYSTWSLVIETPGYLVDVFLALHWRVTSSGRCMVSTLASFSLCYILISKHLTNFAFSLSPWKEAALHCNTLPCHFQSRSLAALRQYSVSQSVLLLLIPGHIQVGTFATYENSETTLCYYTPCMVLLVNCWKAQLAAHAKYGDADIMNYSNLRHWQFGMCCTTDLGEFTHIQHIRCLLHEHAAAATHIQPAASLMWTVSNTPCQSCTQISQ